MTRQQAFQDYIFGTVRAALLAVVVPLAAGFGTWKLSRWLGIGSEGSGWLGASVAVTGLFLAGYLVVEVGTELWNQVQSAHQDKPATEFDTRLLYDLDRDIIWFHAPDGKRYQSLGNGEHQFNNWQTPAGEPISDGRFDYLQRQFMQEVAKRGWPTTWPGIVNQMMDSGLITCNDDFTSDLAKSPSESGTIFDRLWFDSQRDGIWYETSPGSFHFTDSSLFFTWKREGDFSEASKDFNDTCKRELERRLLAAGHEADFFALKQTLMDRNRYWILQGV